MNVLMVGGNDTFFDHVQLAVHVRWPDAICSPVHAADDAMDVIDLGFVDAVFVFANHGARDAIRFCSSVVLQNQLGRRIETSTSTGIHTSPSGSPCSAVAIPVCASVAAIEFQHG